MSLHSEKTKQNFELKADWQPAGDQPNAIKQLVAGIEDGLSHQTLLGVTGSGKTFTIANVIAQVQRPALVLAHNKTLAAQLYGEFKQFFPNNSVEYFVSYFDYYQPEAYIAASDTFIEKDSAINEHIEQMRLSATKAILSRSDTIIVASVSAIYGLGDPELYFQMIIHLKINDLFNPRNLMAQLTELQYQRNDIDFKRGTFRMRGETLDIFPAESEHEALRVQFFDEEIESLTWFDPLTGQGLRKVPRTTIFPKSHYVTPRDRLVESLDLIKDEMYERKNYFLQENKLIEAQRIEERTRYDIEMIHELGYCSGIENYSRYLSARPEGSPPPCLFDYLPEDALLIIDESHVTVPQLGAMYKGDRARKQNLIQYGFRLPSALDNRPLKFEEVEDLSPQTIFVSATPSNYEGEKSGQTVEQLVRPTGLLDPETFVRPIADQVQDVLRESRIRAARGERVLVTTLTKRMAEDLTDFLFENGVRVRYLHSDIDTVERSEILRDLRLGAFDVLVGINLLREGLDLPEVSLVAILDADKQGFLRSERSLIQTIGRAARHLHGQAILYADTITAAMQSALSETERRRAKQLAHNAEHGITPRGIQKAVQDVMHQGYETLSAEAMARKTEFLTLANYEKQLKTLENQMRKAAQDLAFEQAAQIRDEIKALKARFLAQSAEI